ncbi:hypothetical protein FDECE_2167 [Fusarium decemcellulare]|nr:hypothetical protein FDECE_2167 [Fusarium decemcellulare]
MPTSTLRCERAANTLAELHPGERTSSQISPKPFNTPHPDPNTKAHTCTEHHIAPLHLQDIPPQPDVDMSHQQQQYRQPQAPAQQQYQRPHQYQHAQPYQQPQSHAQRSPELDNVFNHFAPTHARRPSNLSEVPTADLASNLGDMDPALTADKHHELLDRLATDPYFRSQMLAFCSQHSPQALHELNDYLANIRAGIGQHQPPAAAPSAVSADQAQLVKEISDQYQKLEIAAEKYRQAGEAYHYWETELMRIQARMQVRRGLADVERMPSYQEGEGSQRQGRRG